MFRNHKISFLGWWLFSSTLLYADPGPVIQFIENKNQWPAPYQFSARVPGAHLFIQPGGFRYYFFDEERMQQIHDRGHGAYNEMGNDVPANSMVDGVAVAVNFKGANLASKPKPFGQSKTYYNYFLGEDTARWADHAYAYDGMVYPSVYPGIDLKVSSSGMNMKYDFVVSAGADVSQIVVEYTGADALSIDANGDFQVLTPLGNIRELNPVAYQVLNGKKSFVECHFVYQEGLLSFAFDQGYDPCAELVIDPLLIFSTYSGATADNWGSTATPGEKGDLYSAGVTNQTKGGLFPATTGSFQVATGGLYDIGILKYDSTGQQLLYATYLGGSESESPHSLVVNSDKELLILGTTSSQNFPTSLGAIDRSFNGGTQTQGIIEYKYGSDIFIARISSEGSQLLSSTYLGGAKNDGLNANYGPLTKNYGDQLRGDIITDDQNNIYVSTVTASADFPVVNGFDLSYNGGTTDALLLKLNPDLTQILWSSFIGGAGTDASHTLKFDKAGNILVAGGTTSPDFPVSTTAYQTVIGGDADGWIAKITPNGESILEATYTGTAGFDQVYFIDLNTDDEVYVYGQTNGNFPVTAGVYHNDNSGQFIQKFNPSLTTLHFSTVFGSGRGQPDISPTAFLVNDCNNLYLAGWGGAVNIQSNYWQSNTVGLPITSDAFQKTTSGSDFYFMVLTDDASQFLYGTYLGGTTSRTHVDGGTSRFDKSGIVYHAVCAGCAAYNPAGRSTSDFPSTKAAWSNTNNSINCNNAAFKFDLSSLKPRIQTNSITLDVPGLTRFCLPDQTVFQNLSIGGETFIWNLGDGTRIVKEDTSMVIHAYANIGKYTVWLTAIDEGTCIGKDSTSVDVFIFNAENQVQDDDAMCFNVPYTLQASGGAQYAWRSADGLFTSNSATPIVNPLDTTRYFITITEVSGCVQKDTVDLAVIPTILPEFEISRDSECSDLPTIRVQNTTDSLKVGDQLFFDFGDGVSSDRTEEIHDFKKDGLYNVKLVMVREFCVTEKIMPMPVFRLRIPNIITPGLEDGANDKFTIQFGDNPDTTPAHYGFKTLLIIYNRWGKSVFESTDYLYDWKGEGLPAGVYYYEVSVDGHATCKSWVKLVK